MTNSAAKVDLNMTTQGDIGRQNVTCTDDGARANLDPFGAFDPRMDEYGKIKACASCLLHHGLSGFRRADACHDCCLRELLACRVQSHDWDVVQQLPVQSDIVIDEASNFVHTLTRLREPSNLSGKTSCAIDRD